MVNLPADTRHQIRESQTCGAEMADRGYPYGFSSGTPPSYTIANGNTYVDLIKCWYTAFVITNIKIIEGGGSSLYLPGEFETFTPDMIRQRVTGSKIEFASEQVTFNVASGEHY